MMSPPPPPELFSDRPVRSDYVERGIPYAVRRFLTVLVLSSIVVGALYVGYKHFHREEPTEIPTIKADKVYKQRPEQPGGIEIPHQDVEVYHELDNTSEASKDQVDHLLPPPEVPQLTPEASPVTAPVTSTPSTTPDLSTGVTPTKPTEKSSPVEDLLADVPTTPKIETTVAPQVSANPSVETPVANHEIPVTVSGATTSTVGSSLPPVQVLAPPPAGDPVKAPPFPNKAVSLSSAPVPSTETAKPKEIGPAGGIVLSAINTESKPISDKKVTEDHPVALVENTSVKVPKGQAAVQLASFPNQAEGEKAVGRLQSRYAATLGDAKLRLVRANLGSKGIYYRIQSQPLPEARAVHVCSILRTMNAGCFLVR